MPQVSVVMAVWNGARFLGPAVRSILEQSFRDLELIVVNDGSTDSTAEILARFKDSRLKVIQQSNQGLASALNRGLADVTSEFVARMDADDVALSKRLELQLRFLREHPEIDILGTQAQVIDDRGRVIGVIRKPVDPGTLARYLEFACPIVHPTYLVRANVYRALGGYRNFATGQDFDFLLRAFDAGFKLANLPDELLLYRRHADAISAVQAKRQMAAARLILELHRSRRLGRPESEQIISRLQGQRRDTSAYFTYWWNMRHKALVSRARGERLRALAGLAVSSFMHFELLSATYRGWRSSSYERPPVQAGAVSANADY